MNRFLNIVGYTYTQVTRTRSFVVGLVVMMAIVGLLVAAPAIIGAFTSHQGVSVVAISNESPDTLPLTAQGLSRSVDPEIRFILIPARQEAHYRALLVKGADDLQGVVVIKRSASGVPAITNYSQSNSSSYWSALGTYLQSDYTRTALSHIGLSTAQQAHVLSPVTLLTVALQTVHTSNYFPVYAMVFLLYMFILLYGINMLMAVASEKSSRVQEILIASAKPDVLMYGKLVGTCLVGLTHYGALILTAVIVYLATQSTGGIDVFAQLTPGLIALFTVYFVLGYFLYASLYGAVASLVSRVEEAYPLAQPISLMVGILYVISIFALQFPNNKWVTVLSLIPFFTPTVMFTRIGMSNVPAWQIALSLLLLLGATAASALLSAKIYRVGVMLYGKRPKLRQVVALMRSR